MHLVDVVLFLHISVALAAFAVAGVLHTIQWTSRAATTTRTLKVYKPVGVRIEPIFPVLALVLFLLGAWLIGITPAGSGIKWSDGWIITAVVGLALMEAVGGAVLAPHSKAMWAAVEAAPDGPIDDELRAKVVDPVAWAAAHFETATALGIVFLMATKPNGVASALIVAGAAALGALIGAAGARSAAPAAAAPASA